ncbi:mCG128282, partial [Mus musculus]
ELQLASSWSSCRTRDFNSSFLVPVLGCGVPSCAPNAAAWMPSEPKVSSPCGPCPYFFFLNKKRRNNRCPEILL